MQKLLHLKIQFFFSRVEILPYGDEQIFYELVRLVRDSSVQMWQKLYSPIAMKLKFMVSVCACVRSLRRNVKLNETMWKMRTTNLSVNVNGLRVKEKTKI